MKILRYLGCAMLCFVVFFALVCPAGFFYNRADIHIIYTNDIHCSYNDEGKISMENIAGMKADFIAAGEHVALVDCGDAIFGDFVGSSSKGKLIVDLMDEAGYDFATIGNHEFDYGVDNFANLSAQSKMKYLASNFKYIGENENKFEHIKPWEIKDFGGTKVGFVGVLTPNTPRSSTLSYFLEEGNLVYDFCDDKNGIMLYQNVQKSVNECKKAGAKYVVALCHLGDNEANFYTSEKLIANTNNIDIVLDGHSHSVIEKRTLQNVEGENVILSSTGANMQNVGVLSISWDGEIQAKLFSESEKTHEKTAKYVNAMATIFEDYLDRIVGTSEFELGIIGADGFRQIRTREMGLGNLIADAFKEYGGADVAIVNGGGIRSGLPSGNITYRDIFKVCVGDIYCMVESTGQEIVDALEIACRSVENVTNDGQAAVGETGAFMQVSGIKFKVNTAIESGVRFGNLDKFLGVEGERRVYDVMIQNGAEWVGIDLTKTYKIASNDYIIKSGGGKVSVFIDNASAYRETVADYEVLIHYIHEVLGGEIPAIYATTQGRITIE